MAIVSSKYQNDLEEIKDDIEQSYIYFKPNYDRWHRFQRFVFISSLSKRDLDILKMLKKPEIEFNILEAYISRLLGEFSKQEPSIAVSKSDFAMASNVDPALLTTIEGYIRYSLTEGALEDCAYQIYKDLLGGGFSVGKIWTAYAHPLSFDQIIRFGRVFDPTLCGFDPIASLEHKGDGRYAYELFPLTEAEFKSRYPRVDISDIRYSRGIKGFNWSYKNNHGKEKILLLAHYYKKKKKEATLVQLSNGQTMLKKEYTQKVSQMEQYGAIEQPPQIDKERKTEITTICRYECVENKVLGYKDTRFEMLPLIFFDGSSIKVRDSDDMKTVQQHTRPYVYQAAGTQQLKNFTGQTLANEIENMVQHKIKIPKEGIPEEYKDAYTDLQVPNTLIYNQFKNNDPNIRLDPPDVIPRVPVPPEVTNTFALTDKLTQNILGSYDAALGINNNQLSGTAIVEGATQSNAAAMPFVVGFLHGYDRVAKIFIDLIPKYLITPRTLPTMTAAGKTDSVAVNGDDPNNVKLNYNPLDLQVRVKAGVNFSIQKSRAMQQITALMQASTKFAEIMNDPTKGLPIILDNLEIRGIDQLKEVVAAAAQEEKNAPPPPDPEMLSIQLAEKRLNQEDQQDQIENALDNKKLDILKQDADTRSIKAQHDITNGTDKQLLEEDKVQTEKSGQMVQMAIKTADMMHNHAKDTVELHHKITTETQKNSQDVKKDAE